MRPKPIALILLAATLVVLPAHAQPGAPSPAQIVGLIESLPVLGIDETVDGYLDGADLLSDDGRYFDVHRVVARRGETLTALVGSTDFDAFLEIAYANEKGGIETIDENDDAWADSNAMVVWTAPYDGTYLVGVSSSAVGESGSFSVAVFGGDQSAYVVSTADAGAASASPWQYVASGTDFERSIDQESVRVVRPGVYEAWLEDWFEESQELPGSTLLYDQTFFLVEVHCALRQMLTLEISYYRAGALVDSSDWRDEPLKTIWAAGTVGEVTGLEVCRRGGG